MPVWTQAARFPRNAAEELVAHLHLKPWNVEVTGIPGKAALGSLVGISLETVPGSSSPTLEGASAPLCAHQAPLISCN